MPRASELLYAKASRNKIPLSGTFELSPICNFRCRMCYVRWTREQLEADGKGLIDWKDWLSLAKTCADSGMLYLLLTGGEPFLYPHFRELYEALHDAHILLSINTNGSLINEGTVEWLKKRSPTRVNITLYGASPETYGRVCGNPDGYARAVNAIRMLRQAGIPVVINASMIPENAGDLEDIVSFGKSLGINTRVCTYMFPPARREREEGDSRFTPEEAAAVALRRQRCQMSPDAYREQLTRNVEAIKKAEAALSGGNFAADAVGDGDWGSADADPSGPVEHMNCRAGRCSFWVSWEGKMSACGMLPFPVETYPFRDPFSECWQTLTDAVRTSPVLDECRGCSKRDICHPCVAMLYAEQGDVNKKAPYLCRLAGEIYRLYCDEVAAWQADGMKKGGKI